MTISAFKTRRQTSSLLCWLYGWLVVLLIAPPLQAADPNVDPEVGWARTGDPPVEAVPPRILWSEELAALWSKALRHPEADLRRQAADSMTRAHQLGMPGLDAFAEDLMNVLETPDEHPVARTAAARALVAVEARHAAPLLAEHARRGPIELSLSVEPALADWDFEPARTLWLERLQESGTRPVLLQLALECLAQVGDPRAIPELKRLVMAESARPIIRLAAAKSLAQFPVGGLTEMARRLAGASPRQALVARLVGVHLLAHQSGDEALELLDQYAAASESTVAAQAMQRLLEIAPERLVKRAASTIDNPDARIRQMTVRALATAPSETSIAALAPVLDDDVPEIRDETHRILLTMSGRDELRPAVIEQTARVLASDRWRGLEQAILILTELDQKQIGKRLLQLLHHRRPEVFVSAAWGLKRLAVPELVEPMFAEAKRFSAEAATAEASREIVAASSQLLEAMGLMDHQPAEPYLRRFIPKFAPYPEEGRTAAIWSLGFLWTEADSLDADLVSQLEARLADVGDPPELDEVRAMAAVSLGRMRSEASLPVLRRWYSAAPGSYVGGCCRWAIEQITGETLPDPEPATQQLPGWFLEPVVD